MTHFEAHGNLYVKCCATCKHWDQHGEFSSGFCDVNSWLPNGIDQHWQKVVTLDLALCSRWEEKEANG
jgi:hypothetical protein